MHENLSRFLITGASSGIGRETALRLSRAGARLFLTARDEEKLNAVKEECMAFGAQSAEYISLDITAPHAAEQIVQQSVASMGGLDGVVHSAGVGLIKAAHETTDAELTRMLNINTRGTFFIARESCRVMAEAKRGLFITIPGILGKSVMKNASAYIASKFAVTGMIKAFAMEYQRAGIRFTLLHLGGVDSPFWDSIEMKVQRDKMIPISSAVDLVMTAILAPPHLALSEIVMQPESHQL